MGPQIYLSFDQKLGVLFFWTQCDMMQYIIIDDVW